MPFAVYNTALNATQRKNVEAYLVARYAIAINTPTITPGRGVFSTAQTVTITADPGATIYYTTDGSTPTTSSATYTAPFSLSSTATVKALAVQSFGSSSVASAFIEIDSTTSGVTRTGLISWFKADNGVSTSGSNVTAWQDMSPEANDAVQSSSTARPTLSASAVNGHPAVSFDGSTDFLELGSTSASFNTGATIMIVTKPTAVNSNARLVEFSPGTASNSFYLSQPSTNSASFVIYSGATPTSVTSSSAITLNQYQLLEAVKTAGLSGAIYTDGVLGASNTMAAIPSASRTVNRIGTDNGGTLFFTGEIAEIMIWSRELTASERFQAEGYLFNRYAIKVNAPLLTPGTSVLAQPGQVTILKDPGASVYYTTDGSTPTTSSTPYTSAIPITQDTTLKAIAVQSFGSSAVSSAYIQFKPETDRIPRSGMSLWYKSDFGVLSSGANVNTWLDMSGNAKHAEQATSGSQPQLVLDDIMGNPGIAFDGAADFLQLPSIDAATASGFTAFVVAKPKSSSGGRMLELGNGSTSDNIRLGQTSTGTTASVEVYSSSRQFAHGFIGA